MHRPLWASLAMPVLLVIVHALTACSEIPVRELAAYREAFTQARASSEQILLDFAADAPRRQAVYAAAAAGEPAASAQGWPRTFDPVKVGSGLPEEDSVAVRLRAWGVVAAYNDALLALAENRPDTAAAVTGFLDALKSFPKDKVVEAAAAATPFAPAVTLAVTLIENELRAARFRQAVEAGAPIVHRFVALLSDDLPPLYKSKEVLATMHYDDVKERVRNEFDRLHAMFRSAQAPDDDDQAQVDDRKALIERINTVVQRVRRRGGWQAIDPAAAGDGESFADERANIASSVARLEELVAQAETIDAEMAALHELFTGYYRLVRRTDSALLDLEQVAADRRRTLPPADDLVRMVIVVRKAVAQFESSRR